MIAISATARHAARQAIGDVKILHGRIHDRLSGSEMDAAVDVVVDTVQTEIAEEINRLARERDGWMHVVGEIAATVELPAVVRVTGSVKDMIAYFQALRGRAELAETVAHTMAEALHRIKNGCSSPEVTIHDQQRTRYSAWAVKIARDAIEACERM